MPKGWAAFIDLRSLKIRFLHFESGHIQDKTPTGFARTYPPQFGSKKSNYESIEGDSTSSFPLRNNSRSNSDEERDSDESCGSLSVQHEGFNDDVQEDHDDDRNGSESGGDSMHFT